MIFFINSFVFRVYKVQKRSKLILIFFWSLRLIKYVFGILSAEILKPLKIAHHLKKYHPLLLITFISCTLSRLKYTLLNIKLCWWFAETLDGVSEKYYSSNIFSLNSLSKWFLYRLIHIFAGFKLFMLHLARVETLNEDELEKQEPKSHILTYNVGLVQYPW